MERQQFDYRKFYADYYGIKIEDGFDVHHIDGNRENNDIDNLILLPSSIHHKYHFCRQESITPTIDMSVNSTYEYQNMRNFCDVMIEIQKWKDYKTNLDMQRRWR